MEVENDVQEVIDKINSGELNKLIHISQVERTEFGVYLQVFPELYNNPLYCSFKSDYFFLSL